MADFMGGHDPSGAAADKDDGMLLPHTSLTSEASDILSPSQGPSLTSPVGFMNQSSVSNSFANQSAATYLSHSALTGLAAAAAHHARFATVSHNPSSRSMQQSMALALQAHSRSGQSGGSNASMQTLNKSSSMDGSFESDEGSGGATLSISYMRQGENFVCSLCGKTVASKAAITRHIQLTHEKKKPFECNICHRRFGYKNILLEHQNIHFGIKPYSCNLCDKRFAARSNLFQHRLLHMKPFHCEVCNKRFDRADQLQRHLKLHPTSNILSCNLCNFQATNVEALNNHLKESHTLQTYNTRSRFSNPLEGDHRGPDLPTQVPLSLPGTSGSSSGAMGNLESEAMRRIDSICSQLAVRNQGPGSLPNIKSEPTSPIMGSSPHGSLPPVSPSNNMSSPPFSVCGDAGSNYPPNMAAGHFRGNSGQGFSGGETFSSGSSSAVQGDDCHKEDLTMISPSPQDPAIMFMGDSPTSSAAISGCRQPVGHFVAPPRRNPSVPSIPGIQAFSRQNRNGPALSPLPLQQPTSDRVRSLADSTSSMSEFFSTLQALIHRSQDIPELNVTISRPKSKQDMSTQHNAVNIQGDIPALNDILVYYESQGKIYRCTHCKILFEERGMYFLHKSLHGELSPWECSICHKICTDKNDFHLHFVNDQHLGH